MSQFDFTLNKQESKLSNEVWIVLNDITKVTTYVRSIKNQGINIKQMDFENINWEDLIKARESLQKINWDLPLLLKFGNLNEVILSEEEKNEVIKLREKIWYHSSRFYELVPHEEFKDQIVPPIESIELLSKKVEMIDNLMNIEQASKILLGAHFWIEKVNPLDYCMKAMGVEICLLDQKCSEFEVIKWYCVATWP